MLVGDGCWEKLVTTGSAPQTISSTVVSVQSKKLVSFGGIVNGVAQQTLHFLDLCKYLSVVTGHVII